MKYFPSVWNISRCSRLADWCLWETVTGARRWSSSSTAWPAVSRGREPVLTTCSRGSTMIMMMIMIMILFNCNLERQDGSGSWRTGRKPWKWKRNNWKWWVRSLVLSLSPYVSTSESRLETCLKNKDTSRHTMPRLHIMISSIITLSVPVSFWHKGIYNRTFSCREANYPYTIKNQRRVSKIPLVGALDATSWFFMA